MSHTHTNTTPRVTTTIHGAPTHPKTKLKNAPELVIVHAPLRRVEQALQLVLGALEVRIELRERRALPLRLVAAAAHAFYVCMVLGRSAVPVWLGCGGGGVSVGGTVRIDLAKGRQAGGREGGRE